MDIKKFDFSCPHCTQTLNKDGVVILNTRRNNGDKGTIHLSATFGNYTYMHEPEIEFDTGELVDFFCPSCEENLTSEEHNNFALLKMTVDNNIDFEVIFSREAGNRKTYIITEDGIESYHD